ncbi:MAG: undecaprenyldiphospho-muramoylpentapeptide beta-N-acetylglucosaminyltransferase [Thermoguttaceae bacterium]|jgi:UDP-N-acetylglucosamine--N-acetylmuramyl-(pentapeptide) pyrophosphoryl-undecaprenol N-acetylglucosamine transferase
MKPHIHVVFAGGGTGGHLFPGLAVAQRLAAQLRRPRITFVGSGKTFEREQVKTAGFDYLAIACHALPRAAREAVPFVVQNLAGYFAAQQFLCEAEVAAVVGLGGYASVPIARAAARARIPLVLLEQNVVPGRATRWLCRAAALVCTSFEQTASQLTCRCPIRLTGNPVREIPTAGASWVPRLACPTVPSALLDEPAVAPNPRDTDSRPVTEFSLPQESHAVLSSSPIRQILVLGGSAGARSLNQNVPRALYKLADKLTGCRILHQTGEADAQATRELYAKLALEATVVAFLADLPDVLPASDLAICRAGGTTVAELAVAGVPALLLPYPHATDDHQAQNARAILQCGGAVVLDERALPGRLDDCLAGVLGELLDDPLRRAEMSAAMSRAARPHAAADVAALIWSLVSSRARRKGALTT